MKTEKVTCDWCLADITDTANAVGYRIVLAAEPLPVKGVPIGGTTCTSVTMVNVLPPLQGITRHFCGEMCLHTWAMNALHKLQRTAPT